MNYRLIRALFVLFCAWPVLSHAAAGTLHSHEGDVRIISGTKERLVKAGMEIEEGDLLRTSANAWALLAMSDGASITVRESTEMRITAYRYAPDAKPAQNRSTLELLKGALRVVTGLIGASNRDGYAIKTATSTMGVRGTDHEPAYYPPGATHGHEPGTYDKVNKGETYIRNARGQQVAVRPGRVAYVNPNAAIAPRLLEREPVFYRRHAEVDRRVAPRREETHRVFEQRHQQLLQERRDSIEKRQIENKKRVQDEAGNRQAERNKALEAQRARQKAAHDDATRKREAIKKQPAEKNPALEARQAQQKKAHDDAAARRDEFKKRQAEKQRAPQQQPAHDAAANRRATTPPEPNDIRTRQNALEDQRARRIEQEKAAHEARLRKQQGEQAQRNR